MYHGQQVFIHHGQPPRSQHCQPWSNMVDSEKPWYHGQPDTGVTLFEQVYPSDEESATDPSSPLAVDDDVDDEEYKCEVMDNAGSSSDDTDYELDSEEHPE